MKLGPSTCLTTLGLALVLAGLTCRATAGDDKSAADPTGVWKVIHSSTNTRVRPAEYTLKLKLNGAALTGTLNNVSTVNGKSIVHEWPIKEAKPQGSEISFSVTHPLEVGRGVTTASYQGKISGDTIKGTSQIEFSGQALTRDWKAERLQE